MKSVIAVLPLILALANAGSVVPVDTSSVNVKHSGQDYSYTIQENRGVLVDPSHAMQSIHQQGPVARSSQFPLGGVLFNQIGQQVVQHDVKPVQGQRQEQVQVQARVHKGEENVNVIVPTVDLVPNVHFIRYPYGPYYPYYPNLVQVV